jgi:hypothetical protein
MLMNLKLGRLHEKHAVATKNHGSTSVFALIRERGKRKWGSSDRYCI